MTDAHGGSENPLGFTALSGGPLRAAVSNAMVRIMHEFYGKGPRQAKTYFFDNYVFCVLEDVLTTVEKTLKDAGDSELVREIRLTFEDLMTKTFALELEKLTGRRVVAYHSQIVFDPDLGVELFVLEPSLEAQAEQRVTERPDVETATLEPPGEVGDVDALRGTGRRLIDAPDVQGSADARPEASLGASREVAVSTALVRVTRELYGRGAVRAKTYIADDYVFCAMEEPLTIVERTLVRGGQGLLVRRMRLRYHTLKSAVYSEQIEQLVGRSVLASHSQIVFDPDVLFQFFVLSPEPPATGETIAVPAAS